MPEKTKSSNNIAHRQSSRRAFSNILRYSLRQKLKNLLEQYELREQHVEAIVKSRELELQLEQAKHNQQVLLSEELTKQVLLLLNFRFIAMFLTCNIS